MIAATTHSHAARRAPPLGVALAALALATPAIVTRPLAAQQWTALLEASARAADGAPLPEALRGADPSGRLGGAALTGALRLDRARLSIAGSGELPFIGETRPGARLATTLATPSWRGVRAVVSGVGAHNPWWGDQPTWHAAGSAQLGWSRGGSGVWVGMEGARLGATSDSPWLVRGVTEVRPRQSAPPVRPGVGSDTAGLPGAQPSLAARRVDLSERWTNQLALGAWRSVRGVVVSAAVRGGRAWELPEQLRPGVTVLPDTLTGGRRLLIRPGIAGDSADRYARRASVEAELRASWARGRLALSGVTGLRRLDQTARAFDSRLGRYERHGWGALDATLALRRELALTASLGNRVPASDVAGILAGAPAARPRRYAVVGVRVSPRAFARPALPAVVHDAPSALELRPAPAGETTVRVRVGAARLVELAGDFTGWKPVPMRRVGADGWEATLAIATGTHRLSIRVDGAAWVAPPGLPPVEDEFGGSAALVVVP